MVIIRFAPADTSKLAIILEAMETLTEEEQAEMASLIMKRDEEEEEEVNYGARTLGRACMYGVKGEVIFRPKGSICRGDQPVVSKGQSARKNRKDPRVRNRKNASSERAKERRNPRGTTATSRPAARGMQSNKPAAKPKSRGGPCMYDAKGKVIYAPSGSDCRDR